MNNINVIKTLFPIEQTEQKTESKLSKFEKDNIQNCIMVLLKRGCMYTIIDPDGQKYSNMPIEEKKPIRVRTQSFKEYVTPILDKLEVGDLISVPFGIYDGAELQANICGRANTRWGAKSVSTSVNKELRVLEVLRLM
jgi:hypothetical protein